MKKKKGVSQQALADARFVSRTAVFKWEMGRGYPEIGPLYRAAMLAVEKR